MLVRKNLFWFILILTTDMFILFCYYRQIDYVKQPTPFEEPIKTILLLNSQIDRDEMTTFGTGRQAFIRHGCLVDRCEIVANLSERPLESYDAIVFNMPGINVSLGINFDHPRRKQHQRYVLFTQESPPHVWKPGVNPESLINYFNWSMTYRRDSDIPLLYGRITPKSVHVRRRSKKKEKLVAWMVTHCVTHGLRERYVEKLKKHVPVDVYGYCGNLDCVRNPLAKCYRHLENHYKFYLSFENSICDDYVTEKFFYILQRNIVPVVYGGANYSAIAPPHSFIDARQFKPKELADYLRKLDQNDDLYEEYFWWKGHYTVEAGVEQMTRHAFCDLCEKLHVDKDVKIYTSMLQDWNQSKQTCYRPKSKNSNASSENEVIPLL